MISYWICWNSKMGSLSTKSMYLQYGFLLNMLEFHTGKPQYEINVSSVWFRTEYDEIPYREAWVGNQCFFKMISYWICWNSILGSLSTKSMYLQYDFVLNMLEFQTGKPQYKINVSSIWFPTEYAGIPNWDAAVWNQCNFNMISYWICWTSILGSLSTKSMYHKYDFELNMLKFHTEKLLSMESM